MELPARAGQFWQEDVLADEEGDQHHQRDLHVAWQERQELSAGARWLHAVRPLFRLLG